MTSNGPQQGQQQATQAYTEGPSNQVDVIDTQAGRILCVADVRGKLSTLNALAIEHNAKAIIHTGDFGFYESSSLSRVSDRTLKHLIQYSNLISPAFRAQLLAPQLQASQLRQMLAAGPSGSNQASTSSSTSSNTFALSEFPLLLSGELKFVVPVYTVWGACEDVSVLERLRVAPAGPITVPKDVNSNLSTSGPASDKPNWSIPNLTVLSESCSRALVIGNVRFRLFGLGGACVQHKLFDNGEGQATIAGGGGTMWTTMLQIGELVDTAQRVYDPSETRILITHASPGREGMLAQLGLVLKADLSISASLHFRYGVSYNEFSVQHDQEAYRNKFVVAKASFNEVWDTVKGQVEAVIDDQQRKFLTNALGVVNRLPSEAPSATATAQQNARVEEESAWKNSWNWNLPDAAFGSLVLDVKDGRVSSEMKSQGFNFSYRAGASKAAPTGPAAIPSGPAKQQQKNGPTPSGPKAHQQQHSQSQKHASQQQQSKEGKTEPTSTPSASQKPAPATQQNTSAPPAASDKEAAAPSQPAQPQANSNSPNPDRPNSAASRRPSHQQHKSNKASEASAPESSGIEDRSTSSPVPSQPNGRGRGRGGQGNNNRGRGSFDRPNRGRGGFNNSRGGHQQNASSTLKSDAPAAQDSSAPKPAASTPAPAAPSGDSKKPNGGIGWD